MIPCRPRAALPFVLLLALLPGCVSTNARRATSAADDARAVTAVLQESTAEWNRGSLDGFLVPYHDASTFVGRAGLVRGKGAIRTMYAESYWRGGRPAGALAFRDVDVRMLGADHALAVGRYVVSEGGRETATGLFSLTLQRTPAGWRIIHDHSS